MRYVSGLVLIGLSLVLIASGVQQQWDLLLVSIGLSIALLLQGIFAFLPGSLAAARAQGAPSRWRQLWGVGVITHALWGLFMLLIAAQQLTEPDGLWDALLIMLIFSLPVLGGAFHLNMIYRRGRLNQAQAQIHQPHVDPETLLIQTAARLNGECTLLELVAHSAINRERVEQLLDSLSRDDLVSIHVDEQGQTFYRFHQLFEAHKARRDILDEEPVLFDHDGESQQQQTIKQPAAHTSKR